MNDRKPVVAQRAAGILGAMVDSYVKDALWGYMWEILMWGSYVEEIIDVYMWRMLMWGSHVKVPIARHLCKAGSYVKDSIVSFYVDNPNVRFFYVKSFRTTECDNCAAINEMPLPC